MEIDRITLPPITAPGEVTTFYSFESSTARSVALSNMAVLLSGRQNATVPVLMIDWDTESPGLHHYFEARHDRHGDGQDRPVHEAHDAGRPGLLEYFEACRDQLQSLGRSPAAANDDELARLVLEAIDWEAYVERVDESRPLYLMRAGRFDDTYGERAAAMDWNALFAACPALYRCFAEQMARHFRHVLIDCRSGRSAAVSVCTALLPRKLVALFTPSQRSLDGLAGVVRRAIEYRVSHEDEQRPLLVYPLPCAIDSADCERRQQWRRGDAHKGVPGYQAALERLLRACYGMSQLSLDSYLDEVQLQQANAMSSGEHLAIASERDGDRFSLTRTFSILLDWVAGGYFPWQSHAEIQLLDAISAARAAAGDSISTAVSVPLARDLVRLGELYRSQGHARQAQACFEESTALRQRLLGDEHADTRASRSALAALLRQSDKLHEAKFLYELLVEDCERLAGADHPETLSARSGLAATLSQLGEFDGALALHEQVTSACERRLGPGHMATLNSLAGQAETLTRQGERSRARMVYERVLEGRQRLLGTEHEDTLRCTQQLAALLCEMGDLNNARKLQETVVRARERHAGVDAAQTLQARETLAEILAAQGDLAAVRSMQESLARARERRLGSEHPETLSIQLRLASTLGQQGELEAARRLQQHVVNLHERIHGHEDMETLRSKKALAATLSSQGNSQAARKLEESVQQVSNRLLNIRAMSSGPHDSLAAVPTSRSPLSDLRDPALQPDTLDFKLAQLQKLIDNRSSREARALADSLRKTILRPSVAHPLRRRGVAMIKQVYQQDGDLDALLAFTQDEASRLKAY
ncbi:tetratricopeptide repeat protein [Massilia horti]|uniref:Tetratricopeptide repeat protein n=1 Tax=Massilia horti TaxID=2562153 RepID=A0A4Y9SPV6_9BURK|nr:tetratricopeptide repeat protein [Massilia horti]TFW28588.1 tetratricopeptide repeat protein [Massilia horti]